MENGEGVFNHTMIRIVDVPQHYFIREIEKEKKASPAARCPLSPIGSFAGYEKSQGDFGG